MAKQTKKGHTTEETNVKKESKEFQSLNALVKKRAAQVFSPDRESFNAADILGITVSAEALPSPPNNSGSQKPTHGSQKPINGSDKAIDGSTSTTPGLAQHIPGMDITDPGMDAPEPVTAYTNPHVAEPTTGVVQPSKVVDLIKNIQTTKERTPGMDQTSPPVVREKPGVAFISQAIETKTNSTNVKPAPLEVSSEERPQTTGIGRRGDMLGQEQQVSLGNLNAEVMGGFSVTTHGFQEAMAGLHQGQGEGTVEERLRAVKIGARLGDKFRSVLMYLNTIRNLQDPDVTVRVGYSRIAERSEVNSDYLRHKILPGLMMRGILSVVDKGLNGTVYRLEHSFSVISLIVGESEGSEETLPLSMRVDNTRSSGRHAEEEPSTIELPAWVDREHWGTLNAMMAQRLVERSGSIERAQEILAILLYNETHGSEHMRVRNRLAVLTRYLQNREMEIWPNDKGFETLAIRQAKQDVDESKRLKELAEQAIKEKREAQLLTFRASLTDEQMVWIREESKRRVHNQRGQHFLKDKFVLYKAEEESFIEEWLERSQYGETVPTVSSQE